MKPIISTKVMSRKCGSAIWLDSFSLNSKNWNKGDTVTIEHINDKTIKLNRKAEKLPRSTETTQNLSGRKKGSIVQTLIELPLKKIGVSWEPETRLKALIETDYILISINDYAEKRRCRISKFNLSIKANFARHLNISVDNLPNIPHSNNTQESDICTLNFNPIAPKSAKFYNALVSIEKSNPFAIHIKNFESKQNTPQDGLVAILKSLSYTVTQLNNSLLAFSSDLEFDCKSLEENQPKGFSELLGLSKFKSFTPSFDQELGNKRDRLKQLENDISNDTMSITSLFHGGGTIEQATIELYSDHGLTPVLKLVSEIDDGYLNHSVIKNSHAYNKDTISLIGDICQFDPSRNKNIKTSIMTLGIVCKGASRAGRSKLKTKNAESHTEAGHLFWQAIRFIAELNPSIPIIENTDSYKSTASFDSIIEVLTALNYEIEYGVIDSHNYGGTETRKRLFLYGFDNKQILDAENIFSKDSWFVGPRRPVSHFIDSNIPNNHKSYRLYEGLKLKEEKDKVAGKGFKRPLYHGDETRTLLIRQSYTKAGSCDPYFVCPTDAEKSRLFHHTEHAQLKGFDAEYVRNCPNESATLLHSVLGQGWTWHSAVKIIGHALNMAKKQVFLNIEATNLSQQAA
ncbi:DNA cytosine methyltransferase [Marinomonas sp. TI.3.20]|uniref:DNA cytosine methyltransferase n=1 Tax=Marinomonas sp. TI.3.20 TaxID=3121296 RepID=UPI0031205349